MQTKDSLPPPCPEQIEPLSNRFFDRYATAIKTVVVGILVLLLLIPLAMIQSLIRERQRTKHDAITDITSKWGGEQTVAGPCLVIPYFETVVEDRKQIEVRRNLLLLPETLHVEGQASVEKRKRGIYDASVYASEIRLAGEFDITAIEKSGIRTSQVRWDEMRVIMGLSDLKGVKEKVQFETNGKVFDFESGLSVENLAQGYATGTIGLSDKALPMYSYTENEYQLFTVGLHAQLDTLHPDTLKERKLSFGIALEMNGSQGLYIVPVGKTTVSQLTSDWATPSFDGNFLPENRTISESGFSADWKVLHLNRSYGQVIRSDDSNAINQMAASRFGVRFIQPVDQYQQNMRSVKYAILIILLTFVVVFFIELIKKKSVNPFQYLLVGV